MGDFNIAPEDRDVHDPEAWRGQVLCSDPEREALRALLSLGLADTFRLFEQPPGVFSWWDYRQGGFRRNLGLRIDLVLASNALAGRCRSAHIDTRTAARRAALGPRAGARLVDAGAASFDISVASSLQTVGGVAGFAPDAD